MIIRGRNLQQILEDEPSDIVTNIGTIMPDGSIVAGSAPASEVVLIGKRARELQEVLARANSSMGQLIEAEQLCMEIHRASCSILAWIAREEKKHEC
jgi:hypothetical protein